jgi:hypothetical protein
MSFIARVCCVSALCGASGASADLYGVGLSEFFVAKYYRVSTEDASVELINANPDDIFMMMIALGPNGRHYTIDGGPYLRRADPLTGESEMLHCVCAQQWPTALTVGDDGIAIIAMKSVFKSNYMYNYDVYADTMVGTVSFDDPELEIFSMIYRSDGVLLGTSGRTVLLVDPLSGDAETIGVLEGDFSYVLSMARDTSSGLTYLIAEDGGSELLYRVDLFTFQTELIGTLPDDEQIYGIASIGCPADFNGDGALNILDFVAFQLAWQAGADAADVNGDGVLDVQDFVAFQQHFVNGCRS